MKKGIFKGLVRSISDIKLKYRLLVSFLLVILIPLAVFTLLIAHWVSVATEAQAKYTVENSINQSTSLISNKLDEVLNSTSVILADKYIATLVEKGPDSLSLEEQARATTLLLLYLNAFQYEGGISTKLYVDEGFLYSGPNATLRSLQSVQDTPWYDSFVANGMKTVLLPFLDDTPTLSATPAAASKKISIIRPILFPDYTNRLVGLLRVDVSRSILDSLLLRAAPENGSTDYVLDSHGDLVASSFDPDTPVGTIPLTVLDKLMVDNSYIGEYDANGQRSLIACRYVPALDWTIVSVTQDREILSSNRNVLNGMLLLLLLIGVGLFAIAFLISNSITRRLALLIAKMRRIQNGDFSTRIESTSQDEIGELIHDFNYMTDRVQSLVSEQFRLGEAAKNAELLALQSQINPHFLYNTLDLINWTALTNNVPEIASTVQSLSKFYKLTLSNGANIIPIGDEIEHLKLYVDLQNRRFRNAISFAVDIEESVLRFTTIKIILQPIAENAILHGILERADKKGHLLLTAHLEGDTVVFTMKDDGVGMDSERVEEILNRSGDEETLGYGIGNVDRRIRLFYGNAYGLSILSAKGRGTTVTIRIPARTNEK